ncbi:MAG: hypothetical protein ACOVK9_00835, partial [Bacteroidia bacterium]
QCVQPEPVKITWQTASETHNDFFEIERKVDAGNFETIGKVDGNGNSKTINNYSYFDIINNNNQSIAYRLKQTDVDGNYAYSKIVNLNQNQNNESSIEVVNPLPGYLHLTYNGKEEEVEIFINYLNGKTVDSFKTALKHENIIPFNKPLAPGMYILRIVQYSRTQTFKIIQP